MRMWEDTPVLFAIGSAAFLIGFSKAGVGGTLGPFVTVLVAVAMPADEAVGLLLPMLIVADGFAVGAHWNRWSLPILTRLLVAAAIGIAVGSLVISNLSEPNLRRIIAAASIAFVIYYFWSKRPRVNEGQSTLLAWPAGVTGGITSTLAHLGGPPIMAYLITTPLKPRPLVATNAALFACINLLKVPGYLAAGLLDADLVVETAWAWLAIPVGVVVGKLVVERINRLWFDRLTAVLLVAGALLLLVR